MTNAHHNVRNNTEASSNGEYFAQPYALDGKGFYFDSIESYTTQATAHSCEEFELQYIDGGLAELFRACDVDQTTIGLWFDQVLDLHDHEQACLFYRCDDLGEDLETARIDGQFSHQQVLPTAVLAEVWICATRDDLGRRERAPVARMRIDSSPL